MGIPTNFIPVKKYLNTLFHPRKGRFIFTRQIKSLCLISKFAMKASGAVDVQIHLFIHTNITLQFSSRNTNIPWDSIFHVMDIIRSQQTAMEGEVNTRKFSQNKNAYAFCYITGNLQNTYTLKFTRRRPVSLRGLLLAYIISFTLSVSLSLSLSLSTIQLTQCS